MHVFTGKKINLVKFNFVEKGGSTGKSGVQTLSACEKHRYFFALTVTVKSNSCLDELFSYTLMFIYYDDVMSDISTKAN